MVDKTNDRDAAHAMFGLGGGASQETPGPTQPSY